MAPPSVVIGIVRPLMDIIKLKEVPIGAVLRDVGALFIVAIALVDALPIQPFIEGSAVIENTVQQHTYAALVHLLHEMDEEFVAGLQIFLADHALNILRCLGIIQLAWRKQVAAILFDHCIVGIDIVVILTIVLVIGRGHEYRVHVNDLDAQILQIIQFIQDALQIAAVEPAHVHVLRRFAPVLYLFHLLVDIAVFSCQHIIGGIAVAEAIHVDLVHDRALGPVRRSEARNDAERIAVLQIIGDAQLIIKKPLLIGTDFKIIIDGVSSYFNVNLIIIKAAPGTDLCHRIPFFTANKIYSFYIILCSSKA